MYGDYWFSRFIIQRSLGVIYLIAFVNALNQFPALLGENGLLPLPRFLTRLSFSERPSIFHWHYSDRFFKVVAWAGILLALLAISSLADRGPLWLSMIVWFLLWALYLSIVNVGVVFYGYGWESMVLEIGFYSIFWGPLYWSTPVPVVWVVSWMLFRVEFGAGLIKMRGDPCWRKLTCMNYHHETQPLPNPLSWYFHHAPSVFHKVETLGNHMVQLVLIWGLFLPQPIASVCATFIILSQFYLVLSGNYSWLNWLTIVLAFSGYSDAVLSQVFGFVPPDSAAPPPFFLGLVAMLALTVVILSIKPVQNMLSKSQKMNFSFNPVHLVNTYGAFGSVTKKRFEVIIEGTQDEALTESTNWKAYEFKGKPGDVSQRPVQIAPYHLRLDWQLWFAAMTSSHKRHIWFEPMVIKLLNNDESVLKLIRHNPFPDRPPTYIRAQLFQYQYTSPDERKETGHWWKREYVHQYMAPQRLH